MSAPVEVPRWRRDADARVAGLRTSRPAAGGGGGSPVLEAARAVTNRSRAKTEAHELADRPRAEDCSWRCEVHEATIRQTRIRGVVALVVLAVASLALASGAGAGRPSDVLGQLYVNDNTTGVNTVAGFDRHADGSLTPHLRLAVRHRRRRHRSRLGSQGSMQESADGRYLLAVDAGSNEISVLRIKPHGDLRGRRRRVLRRREPGQHRHPSATSSTSRTSPTTPQLHRLHSHAGGHLTRSRLDGDAAGGSAAGRRPLQFDGTSSSARAKHIADRQLRSRRERSSRAAPGSPFAAQGLGPFGRSSGRRTRRSSLSATHTAAPATAASRLSPPQPTGRSPQSAPRRSRTTRPPRAGSRSRHDGNFLFAVNTAVSTISSYSIAANGSLTLLGNTTMDAAAHGPEDARLSPDGSTLWVVDTASNAISGFAVSGGTLTELRLLADVRADRCGPDRRRRHLILSGRRAPTHARLPLVPVRRQELEPLRRGPPSSRSARTGGRTGKPPPGCPRAGLT